LCSLLFLNCHSNKFRNNAVIKFRQKFYTETDISVLEYFTQVNINVSDGLPGLHLTPESLGAPYIARAPHTAHDALNRDGSHRTRLRSPHAAHDALNGNGSHPPRLRSRDARHEC
jgi:hypothetical protein